MISGNLHCLALIYSEGTGKSLATISNLCCGHARLFQRLAEGCSCTLRTYKRVTQWFSNNWPVDLDWPADIPRPDPADNSPYRLAMADRLGVDPVDLNESRIDSDDDTDPTLKLDDRGQLADPAALCLQLAREWLPDGIDPTPNAAALQDSYYQVIRIYADGRPRASRWPRKGSRAAALLDRLLQAGDVRFADRAAQRQRLLGIVA